MGLAFKTWQVSGHALRQCDERGIRVVAMRDVALQGEVIHEYPEDKPYPSYLLLGAQDGRLLHVVAALDAESEHCILVTAYWPDPAIWDDGARKRRSS
jgi:hypothetical protein